jgi:hypothetical protein
MSLSESFQEIMRENEEKRDYKNANLWPVLKSFACSTDATHLKAWSWCDMLFTCFLMRESTQRLYQQVDGGHALYMHHLQTWSRALSRDEARDEFQDSYRQEFHVLPRVSDAENILQQLVDARAAFFDKDRRHAWSNFDTLLQGTSEVCHKPYKLFCLCLTYVVQEDSPALYRRLIEFHNTVTCGWFEAANTDDAGAFVARAEIFFKRNLEPFFLLSYASCLWLPVQ